MASTSHIYSLLPVGVRPSATATIDAIRRYGFQCEPTGYAYRFEGDELIEACLHTRTSEGIVNAAGDEIILADNAFAFFHIGYVECGGRVFGVIDIASRHIDGLKAYLATRQRTVLEFFLDIYATQRAELMVGISEFWGGLHDIVTALNDADQSVSLPLQEMGLLIGAHRFPWLCSSYEKFTLKIIEDGNAYLAYPFE